jgi:hypothetical protein
MPRGRSGRLAHSLRCRSAPRFRILRGRPLSTTASRESGFANLRTRSPRLRRTLFGLSSALTTSTPFL